jgi:hypothetical protein
MIPAFLIQKFGPLASKLIFFGGIVLLAGALLLLTYCAGRSDGKTGEVVKQQEREIQVQRDLGNANENAATSRVEDATRAAQQKEELNHAIKDTNSPDRARALRGCIILRQQGRDTVNIPACR